MIVTFFADAYAVIPTAIETEWSDFVSLLRESSQVSRNTADKLTWTMMSPAIYAEDGQRSIADVVGVEWLAIDYDDGTSIFEVEAWCRSQGLAYVVYTTSKSSGDMHRFRLVIPLTGRVEAAAYPALWSACRRMLPGTIDPATKDVTRLSVMPAHWAGSFFRFAVGEGAFLNPNDVVQRYPEPPAPTVKPRRYVAATNIGNAYIAAAVAGEVDNVTFARPGTRNDTLLRSAYSLGRLVPAGLDREMAHEALLAATTLSSVEAKSVISRGLDAGARNPRN